MPTVKRLPAKLRRKAEKISLLLLDVDGVLTDGRIIVDDRGVETKHFDVKDGQGIALLRRCGIDVGIITGRSSGVVRHRARELGIRLVYQRVKDKLETYQAIKRRTRLADHQIAYMGDDIIDLPLLKVVGLSATVADCWPGLQPVVDFVTAAPGGRGAVREVAELLLKAQGKWQNVTKV